jgi:hypothetical protein
MSPHVFCALFYYKTGHENFTFLLIEQTGRESPLGWYLSPKLNPTLMIT